MCRVFQKVLETQQGERESSCTPGAYILEGKDYGQGGWGQMRERREMKATGDYVIVESTLRQCHLNRYLN